MNPSQSIDYDRFSRQVFVLGQTAQSRLQTSDVLIVGLRGLGCEIAKNLCLMGVRSITLFDNSPTSILDLSSQFYLRKSDVGQPKAAACASKLSELSSSVSVRVITRLGEDDVRQASVIVCTDENENDALALSKLVRSLGKHFVLSESHGVFGRVFCDFGDKFVVEDVNGEPELSGLIESITISQDAGVVTMLDQRRHGLEDGDVIGFKELAGGIAALNQSSSSSSTSSSSSSSMGIDDPDSFSNSSLQRNQIVKVVTPSSFSIGPTAAFSSHVKNSGSFFQIKSPKIISFSPLIDMINAVGLPNGPKLDDFLPTDFGKVDSLKILHSAFAGLHRIPDKSLMKIVNYVQQELSIESLTQSETTLIGQIHHCFNSQLPPMNAVLGGIAAQEVIKAVTGKFMPLKQWLYIDAAEALLSWTPPPPSLMSSTSSLSATSSLSTSSSSSSSSSISPLLSLPNFLPLGSRYDDQISVFGRDFQVRLGRLRYFLVGAGAIGCELLKNFAMMGVGCGEHDGAITVTDMDHIEKSNLSRQFLFREGDIGKSKSAVAAAAAAEMNPDLNIQALDLRVAPDTESTFSHSFWSRIDGVCTALDNIEARKYVDSRCVYFGLPMLESGTLGTKGNTQIVIPHLSESYGATNDPPEEGIPVCTLKNFPNKIEHTLQGQGTGTKASLNSLLRLQMLISSARPSLKSLQDRLALDWIL